MRKLFIPLCSDPFKWFQDGTKEWELRKQRASFNKKTINVGQVVELCRGYVAKNGVLWGRVCEVREYHSLREVLEDIPFSSIVNLDDLESAIEYICQLMNISLDEPEDFIAIRIKKIPTMGEIVFDKKFLGMIKNGNKTTTVRRGAREYLPGYYCAYNDARTSCELINVKNTRLTEFGLLSTDVAITDGYSSVEQLKSDLHAYYPDLFDSSIMTIVCFERCE